MGATVGVVNDVEDRFRLDGFDPSDAQVWVDYRLDDNVLLRATGGSIQVKGDNAGEAAVVGSSPIVLPDLETRIDYGTVGVSYEFREGAWTSGLFGGIGAYKINPDPAPASIANFRDRNETVFGWHAGADADLRVLTRLSIVARLTFHRVLSRSGRSLLSAGAGALYRF